MSGMGGMSGMAQRAARPRLAGLADDRYQAGLAVLSRST
ncbi:hypothetical protein C7410_109211 [Paraburkholderia silvatlantica]|uniref:Uncharacterized protein n=1 Tax=Paraburkholderia silvatlantica TaxID=321895 RepID=A0A2V4TXJ7_9BURK|nr:hypothetical protein C7410_109211 [Paraburkholderia silvatlantica]